MKMGLLSHELPRIEPDLSVEPTVVTRSRPLQISDRRSRFEGPQSSVRGLKSVMGYGSQSRRLPDHVGPPRSRHHDRWGFTFTSTTVAIVLAVILLGITGGFLVFGHRGAARGGTDVDLQRAGLTLLHRLTKDLIEAREVLHPVLPERPTEALAFLSFDQQIVVYRLDPRQKVLLRETLDPSTWTADETQTVCRDVDSIAFRSFERGQVVSFGIRLAREIRGTLRVLPLETAISLKTW